MENSLLGQIDTETDSNVVPDVLTTAIIRLKNLSGRPGAFTEIVTDTAVLIILVPRILYV